GGALSPFHRCGARGPFAGRGGDDGEGGGRLVRIAMVGVGGVGGYFGGKLAHAGFDDVVFIARGATLQALRARGLRIDSIGGDFVVERVNATDDPASVGVVDAVVFAVKAWQIPEAAERVRPRSEERRVGKECRAGGGW